MNFLETITWMGNDALVPIKDIQYINFKTHETSYEIEIKGKDALGWSEHFDDEKKARERYEMIKKIIGAK